MKINKLSFWDQLKLYYYDILFLINDKQNPKHIELIIKKYNLNASKPTNL